MENKVHKQAAKKKRKGVKPVQKPFVKGVVYSPSAMKRSAKVLGLYLAYMFFFLIIGASLTFDNVLLNLLMNVGAIVATVGMLYVEGLRNGDTDVSLGEIIYLRKESGRDIDRVDLEGSYHPMKGVVTALVGAGLFLLLAIAHAVLAEPQYYTLGVLPGWVESVTAEEVRLPLAYYDRENAFAFADLLRILTRLSLIPYINIVSTDSIQGMLLVDRLSPLLIMLPAAGYVAGYLRGPSSRAYTHGSIAANTRRHKRKQQKERKARENRNKQIV